jgi:hypothetical protein
MMVLNTALQVIPNAKLPIHVDEEILYLGLLRIMCFTAYTKKCSIIFSLTGWHAGYVFRGRSLLFKY